MNEDKIALDKAIDYFANIGYDYQVGNIFRIRYRIDHEFFSFFDF